MNPSTSPRTTLSITKTLKDAALLFWNNLFRILGVGIVCTIIFVMTFAGVGAILKLISVGLSYIGINTLENGGNAFFALYSQDFDALKQNQTPEIIAFECALGASVFVAFSLASNIGLRYLLAAYDRTAFTWHTIKNVALHMIPLTILTILPSAISYMPSLALSPFIAQAPEAFQTAWQYMASVTNMFQRTYFSFACLMIMDRGASLAAALQASTQIVFKNGPRLFLLNAIFYTMLCGITYTSEITTLHYGPSCMRILFSLILTILLILYMGAVTVCAYRQCIPANDKSSAL